MAHCMYYIAIVAPEDIDRQVLRWKHFMRDGFGCKNALKSPAHITLIPPFWQDESIEPGLKEFLNGYAGSRNGFNIELNGFGAFGKKVIYINVIPSLFLDQLRASIVHDIAEFGILTGMPDMRPFHPHITIATRDLFKKDFEAAWETLENQSFHSSFDANSITLMKHNGATWDQYFTAGFP